MGLLTILLEAPINTATGRAAVFPNRQQQRLMPMLMVSGDKGGIANRANCNRRRANFY
jgi:hypothetical protein